MAAKEEELEQKTEALDVLAGNADKFTEASQVHATELEAVQNKLREAIADLEKQAALVIAKEETIQKGYAVVGELEDQLEAAKESTEAGLTSQRRQQAAAVAELETKAAAEAELARRLEGRLEAAAELAGQLELARGEAGELRVEVYKLKFDVAEAEKQRDMVDEECDKLEEKFKNKADQVVTLEKEKEKIKKHLLEQKEYSDKMFEINQRLKLPVDKFEAEGVRAKTKETMEAELERVKEELGKKNIEFASLKVDVEKDELVFKKKCNVLQVSWQQ
jgi:chromosome segregation ATPase